MKWNEGWQGDEGRNEGWQGDKGRNEGWQGDEERNEGRKFLPQTLTNFSPTKRKKKKNQSSNNQSMTMPETFLFTSESVGEGHPGMCLL
jgi:hypothetical protein